ETLGIPHIADVKKIIAIDERQLTCVKVMDGGEQELTVSLPALITVSKDINMPRLPSIAGVRFSLDAPCQAYSAVEVKADTGRTGLNGSPTQVVRTFTPERRGEAVALQGSCPEQAAQILAVING
ncbi:MAG: electron transfer flavoprotein subunit beta, partial [Clostridiales bacterium]